MANVVTDLFITGDATDFVVGYELFEMCRRNNIEVSTLNKLTRYMKSLGINNGLKSIKGITFRGYFGIKLVKYCDSITWFFLWSNYNEVSRGISPP